MIAKGTIGIYPAVTFDYDYEITNTLLKHRFIVLMQSLMGGTPKTALHRS
ncbi:hypothetical protein [Moorena sp. SIO4G3]|nr:hypothetical protein [Moorena sp. SIO4G3]